MAARRPWIYPRHITFALLSVIRGQHVRIGPPPAPPHVLSASVATHRTSSPPARKCKKGLLAEPLVKIGQPTGNQYTRVDSSSTTGESSWLSVSTTLRR